ncbi:MAG: response regulator [Verrucomicrobiales bacterium]|nr:response regulator [Verrucomicrobiales bacterium]
MKPPESRILVIDDNPAIHEDFDKILAPAAPSGADALGEAEALLFGSAASGAFPAPAPVGSGFVLSHALQGEEGFHLARQAVEAGSPYAVAFIDMRMPPGWDGLQTAERILSVDPAIQIVICTAYSDYSWDEIRARLGRPDGLLILKKPFDVVEVLQIAHNLTRKWEMAREITHHVQALDRRVEERTAALKASREHFATLFRSAPLAQMIVDSRGPERLEVNEALCRLTGCGPEIWSHAPAALRAIEASGLGEVLRWHHPIEGVETTLQDRAGMERQVLISSVIIDRSGTPSLLLMIHDVTERKKLESDIRQMQKLDAVGQLAAGVAHDFNNLLTVIAGNAQLARQARESGLEFEEQLIEEIIESSARAANLTRQLLAFTRRQVFQPRPISLNQLLENQISLLARLLGEHIEIVWQPVAAGDWVHADVASIEQVVLNLAINARDAMLGGGRLTLATSTGRIDDPAEANRLRVDPGAFVCLTCSDTGAGMEPEVAERVFEPFFTTKEIGKGTGLGLASAFGIVQRHRGAITLDTAPGRGANFRVLLPSVPVPDIADRESGLALSGASAGAPGLDILVVEDEPAVRRIALRLLQSLGHRAIEAIDGHSGLAKWRERRREIDLVITDLVMPGGMSGLQLAETIQSERPELPIILASGYSSELIEGSAAPMGPLRRFIPKPYDQAVLAETISSLPIHEKVDLERIVTLPG